MARWWLLVLVVLAAVMVGGLLFGTACVGGGFSRRPDELKTGISAKAKGLIDAAFADVEPGGLLDYHAHLVGLGVDGTGAFVHPHMRSWWHPIARVKFAVYASAAAIEDLDQADPQYVDRLAALVRNIEGHGRVMLLAFDKNYRSDGTVNLEQTEFYTPNEYAFAVARAHPDLFVPAISVHPYRPDALEELEKWARRGARIVKWLPNAMGMDPSDDKCVPFYEKMKAHDMILLSHAGEEKAVDAEEAQKLGNPLRLRRPLDMGVKVVVAHCASLGQNEDLDSPDRELTDNFELFMRLMDDPRYRGLLFGEMSAMIQYNRLPGPLQTMLDRDDLHDRLVNGSDYPLPAINIIVRTGVLEEQGFITQEERALLNEIYDYNPLLFDYVAKRTVRSPKTGKKLPPSVFMTHPDLAPMATTLR